MNEATIHPLGTFASWHQISVGFAVHTYPNTPPTFAIRLFFADGAHVGLVVKSREIRALREAAQRVALAPTFAARGNHIIASYQSVRSSSALTIEVHTWPGSGTERLVLAYRSADVPQDTRAIQLYPDAAHTLLGHLPAYEAAVAAYFRDHPERYHPKDSPRRVSGNRLYGI